MLRRALAVLLFLIVFAAGFVAGRIAPSSVHADKPPRNILVPRQYGTFRSVYHDQLLFEDDGGTIRSVFPNGGMVVFTVSRR